MAKKEFETGLYKLLSIAFSGKNLKHIRNRVKLELIKKDDTEKITKQQSTLIFNGIHNSYTNYDS